MVKYDIKTYLPKSIQVNLLQKQFTQMSTNMILSIKQNPIIVKILHVRSIPTHISQHTDHKKKARRLVEL
jgi:hypothetical protein